jgi:mono/diheme cytochrome c family protein
MRMKPLLMFLGIACGLAASRVAGAEPATVVDFGRDVQPVFKERCYKCHSAEQSKGGFRLDSRRSAFEGGDSGKPAIVPKSPATSRLLQFVRGTQEGEVMPPKGERLTESQIRILETWISQGAPWPDAFDVAGRPELKHWAFRRPQPPPAPAVHNARWVRNGVDPFVLASMEARGLSPAPEADVHSLVRRVALDLTGLPPTPAEVDAYVADTAPGAYERMVDHFLASPAYGERWARLWLDLARYADSKGYGSDPLRPYMWRYRDWVIDAFNRNLPYDQFTIEQLAGDLLPNARVDQLLATAFHRNTMANDEGGTDDEEFRVAAIKDRIDVTMQVWMGLTFGCAKCHSHKYDPISQREYYSFFAFFNQTADADRNDDSPRQATPTEAQQKRLDQLKGDLAPLREELEHPRADFSAAQARWTERVRQSDREWQVLAPLSATALSHTELYHEPDHALAAVGAVPATNTYTLEFPAPRDAVTAIKVELLPSSGGSVERIGRGSASGVHLSEIRLTARPAEPRPPEGRYVRVELPGKQKFLSLAEVEAWSGGRNVAREGKASQSSTDFGGEAPRAIDGNTSGEYTRNSVTHTRASDDPWWEVDLGKAQRIERIVVWNRGDGVEDRLSGYRVTLLDEQRHPVVSQSFAQAPRLSQQIPLNGEVQVAVARATASRSEPGHEAGMLIDGDAKSFWSPDGDRDRRQEIVLTLAKPLVIPAGDRLVVTLAQNQADRGTLARCRVLATGVEEPLPALPSSVRVAASTPVLDRTAEQERALRDYYWRLTPEFRALQERIKPLEEAMASVDREVVRTPILKELPLDQQRKTHMLIKGNFLNPGDAVSAVVPSAFHPFPEGAPTNRLGVARWLVDPANPLTARVAVNRFWAALFSRGLVETEEDFGTQGTPPTHPELLDWLATEYLRLGWDTKAFLKMVVSSATYRQSVQVTPEKLQKDPRNVWLSHAPRPRLEAEIIRDQALALSGLLSRKMHGPSVYPIQPPNLWQAAFNGERNWATSDGEDRHRRALYTFWRRTVPYPSMITFDAPSREYCTIRRIPSNTPLQAFVTLNDPVYVEAAEALARRIQREGGEGAENRLRWAYKLATSRPVDGRQLEALMQLYRESLERFRADPTGARQMAFGQLPGDDREGADAAESAAWTVVANVLLNLDVVLTKG